MTVPKLWGGVMLSVQCYVWGFAGAENALANMINMLRDEGLSERDISDQFKLASLLMKTNMDNDDVVGWHAAINKALDKAHELMGGEMAKERDEINRRISELAASMSSSYE